MPLRITNPKRSLTCLSISGIPTELYEEFKAKISKEGYTVQEGFYLLMKAYLEDRIDL